MIAVNDDIRIAEHELVLTYVTSSGPGGQNVNRVATAAHLRFDVERSASLPIGLKWRLRSIAGRRLSGDGVLVIKAQRYRSQDKNRDDAIERLLGLLRRAAIPPVSRRQTRPTRAAVERRLDDKRRRSSVKRSRSLSSGPE